MVLSWSMLDTYVGNCPATQSGTKSYILRSSLDLDLVQVANRPDAALRELEQTENADENEELAEDDNPVGAHSTGSILSASSSAALSFRFERCLWYASDAMNSLHA